MSVTLGTSHSRIDSCEPPEPSMFGDSFRHASTALSRSALDAGEKAEVVVHTVRDIDWSGWTCKHFRFACLWMGPSIPTQLVFEANFIRFVAVRANFIRFRAKMSAHTAQSSIAEICHAYMSNGRNKMWHFEIVTTQNRHVKERTIFGRWFAYYTYNMARTTVVWFVAVFVAAMPYKQSLTSPPGPKLISFIVETSTTMSPFVNCFLCHVVKSSTCISVDIPPENNASWHYKWENGPTAWMCTKICIRSNHSMFSIPKPLNHISPIPFHVQIKQIWTCHGKKHVTYQFRLKNEDNP